MTAEQVLEPKINLLVIIASTRPGRVGLPVGTWIADVAREHGAYEVTIADLKEIDLPLMNEPNHPRLRQYTHEHTKQWSAMVEAADAYLFVMPEYNFAMTAPLKNAIDYLSLEWGYKPVGLVSYGGLSGGLRAAQMVKQTVTALKMMPVSEAVALPMVGQSIDDDGNFAASDSATRSAGAMLNEVRRWAIALQPLRNGDI